MKKIIALILMFILCGCSVPAGSMWVKDGVSREETAEKIGQCKTITFLVWPLDNLDRCMERRGFELVTN